MRPAQPTAVAMTAIRTEGTDGPIARPAPIEESVEPVQSLERVATAEAAA